MTEILEFMVERRKEKKTCRYKALNHSQIIRFKYRKAKNDGCQRSAERSTSSTILLTCIKKLKS